MIKVTLCQHLRAYVITCQQLSVFLLGRWDAPKQFLLALDPTHAQGTLCLCSAAPDALSTMPRNRAFPKWHREG